MRRKLFTLAAGVSAVLCAAACVLWAAHVRRPRVGNGWFIGGSRYTLSLSPGQVAVLGPPPPPTDPATREFVGEVAAAMRATGGTLRYHGTTGLMGFGDLDFGEALGTRTSRLRRVGNAPVRMLMAALEDQRLFLIAHALLIETEAGSKAYGHSPMWLKLSLNETAGRPGHWTCAYDGVNIELVEDRPRVDRGSWLDEMWAVVTAAGMTPRERARVCRQWHERLDVPLWTVRYSRLAVLTLALPALTFAGRIGGRLRRHRRRVAGRCPACGYNLRATPGRCPECGAVPATARRRAARLDGA